MSPTAATAHSRARQKRERTPEFYSLWRKPVVQFDRKHVGARRAEGGAKIAPRRKLSWPRRVRRRQVPHEKEGAPPYVFPTHHDSSAKRFVAEIRIVRERDRLE